MSFVSQYRWCCCYGRQTGHPFHSLDDVHRVKIKTQLRAANKSAARKQLTSCFLAAWYLHSRENSHAQLAFRKVLWIICIFCKNMHPVKVFRKSLCPCVTHVFGKATKSLLWVWNSCKAGVVWTNGGAKNIQWKVTCCPFCLCSRHRRLHCCAEIIRGLCNRC